MLQKEWDNYYSDENFLSNLPKWPYSDLIAVFTRNSSGNLSGKKVLELGCGFGNNIPFFKSLNMEYYAIEGNQSAVDYLAKEYPEFRENIIVGDFSKSIDFDVTFDFNLIVAPLLVTIWWMSKKFLT